MDTKNIKFQWSNFRGYTKTGWLDFKPLTIIIGPNSSGKSSLIQPLLMLDQTLYRADQEGALITNGKNVDGGVFSNIVHNPKKKHENSIHFEFKFSANNKPGKKSSIGDLPPNFVSLKFKRGSENQPKLNEFLIRDALGRILLKRTLLTNNKYSLKFFLRFPHKTKKDKDILRTITNQQPNRFLFNDGPIIKKEYEYLKNSKSRNKQMQFTPQVTTYMAVLSVIEAKLLTYLNSIRYLGPLRNRPKRFYEFTGEKRLDVGVRGEHTHAILYRIQKDKDKLNTLQYWLREFGLAEKIECIPIPKHGLVEIVSKPIKCDLNINVSDSGFGLSQLLPLILQAIISKTGSQIITEQPEIHLNPKLETKLAEFCVKMAKEGKSFVIETHSEHFLLRLRTLIRRGDIAPTDVGIFFTENVGKECKVKSIKVDNEGNFPNNDWPQDFFDQTLAESLRFVATIPPKK